MTTEKALTDAQIETLIENSGGFWREDMFVIEGSELTAMLQAAAALSLPETAGEPVASDARAFHAHEQRVREEQHRATVQQCAQVVRRRADSLIEGSGIARQCEKDVLSQMDVLLNGSTAPQPSTATLAPYANADKGVYGPEYQNQPSSEAAALLRAVLPLLDGKHDASAQYEDMRGYTAEQIREFLAKQGGK